MRIGPVAALVVGVVVAGGVVFAAGEIAPAPKPQFSGAYFGKMPRAWVEILKVDADRRLLMVRTRKGEEREVPIRPDTELRVRDAWGDLTDYYPGESVMLFVYPDAEGKWIYPRAVQDEIQMMSQHKWSWTVDALDGQAGTIDLSRKEKDKIFRESFRVGPDTKVWKGAKTGTLDTLKVGDVVLFQTRYDKGQDKRFAVELMDAEGLAAVKAEQQVKHRKRLDERGLDAVVNDLDVLTGAVLVSVQWDASDAAGAVRPGDQVELIQESKDAVRFAAPVSESRADGARHKLLLAANPADMVRLHFGDAVRVLPKK
jgi:hypothetical protein